MTADIAEEGCTADDHDDDSELLFHSLKCRLDYLEIWRELGVRPSRERCHVEDRDLLLNLDGDDLEELSRRCLEARRSVNDALPPHELARDDDLTPMPSGIKGAGMGLFFRPPSSSPSSPPAVIREGEIICYYCGHLHDFHSRKTLKDTSYLMLVTGELFVDPGPLPRIKARYINDPLNERYVNCHFVPQPEKLRCAVVATRDIVEGEELFVSYGEGYWSQRGGVAGTVYKGP